jgi:hypothetical protein
MDRKPLSFGGATSKLVGRLTGDFDVNGMSKTTDGKMQGCHV